MPTWKKVVTESSSGNISQKSATSGTADNITSQGTLATRSTVTNTHIADDSITRAKLLETNSGTNGYLLSSDGQGTGFTWVAPTSNTNTTYSTSLYDNSPDVKIRLTGSDSSTDDISILGPATSMANQIAPSMSGSNLTLTIGTNQITHNRYQNIASGSILYRRSSGSGSPEATTLAQLKTDLGLTGTNSGDQTVAYTSAIAVGDGGLTQKNFTTTLKTKLDGISVSADVNRTLDSTPTNGNTSNSVSSDGVYDALANKAAKTGSASQDFSTNNLSVNGNLSITGTSEIRNTTTETINIGDNIMVLNSDKTGSGDVDAGLIVERGDSGHDQTFYYDEGNDRWQFGSTTAGALNSAYQGDVLSLDYRSTYSSSSAVVPIGHLQYAGGTLYVRTA